MDSYIPDLESTRVKVALAFSSYATDSVRLVDPDLSGFTHIVASRQGLYVVNECSVKLIAHGFFFGITVRGDDLFVFEACDLPRGPTFHGRLLRFEREGDRIARTHILIKGLDNGCHQIDFVGDRLLVIDTYNQQVLSCDVSDGSYTKVVPLPRTEPSRWLGTDGEYRHVNSLLAVGERILLLLHNGAQHTGRSSEIAVFNHAWEEQERWTLDGTGCHGLAMLDDGTLLTCGSMEGRLISADGFRKQVSPYLTRGLSVGREDVVVGASQLVEREGRLRNSGTVTFMDRAYTIKAVLKVPGAPTEIRRLDGQDAGLSEYVARVLGGVTMKAGTTA